MYPKPPKYELSNLMGKKVIETIVDYGGKAFKVESTVILLDREVGISVIEDLNTNNQLCINGPMSPNRFTPDYYRHFWHNVNRIQDGVIDDTASTAKQNILADRGGRVVGFKHTVCATGM